MLNLSTKYDKMLLHQWRQSQIFWLLSYSAQLSLHVHWSSDAKKNKFIKKKIILLCWWWWLLFIV